MFTVVSVSVCTERVTINKFTPRCLYKLLFWVLFSAHQLFLVERAGRRTLHLVGLAGMAVSALIMTISLALVVSGLFKNLLSKLLLLYYIFSCTLTPSHSYFCAENQPVLELSGDCGCFCLCCQFWDGSWSHPLVHRRWALLSGASACCHGRLRLLQLDSQLLGWVGIPKTGGTFNTEKKYSIKLCPACFITDSLSFFQELCGPYVFLIFMVFLIIFFIFTYLKVPETKGRTFDDIAQGFAAAPAQSLAPEAMVVNSPTSPEPVPLSPTEKVPMVDLPSEKQWVTVPNEEKTSCDCKCPKLYLPDTEEHQDKSSVATSVLNKSLL